MLKTITIAIIFAAVSTFSAHADSAFGIEYGGELPSGAVEKKQAGEFRLSNPPKPHSLFESYSVTYTDETGVCYISAYSVTFENDKYGTKAKSAYDKLVKTLDKKYGPNGDNWEMLREGAIWDEADEFAMSLLQGDREHSQWFKPSADSQNEFDYVQISIDALDSSNTSLILSYRNRGLLEKCTAVQSSGDDGSL
tara:strand:+ start:269 stop:853 length:585 start_codon:yes stop_codon:yes gene_type:complete